MKTAVFTAATKSYAYALPACAKAMARSLSKSGDDVTWIVATDEAATVEEAVRAWGSFGLSEPKILDGFTEGDSEKDKAKYKEQSQLLISRMQQACLDEATKLDADLYFSVESDILIHPHAYRGLKWLLECPVEPRYSVAVTTYFNGSFLCGRGTPQRQIAEDFAEDERAIPPDLEKKIKENKSLMAKLAKERKRPSEEQMKNSSDLHEEIKKCHPKGNVFEMNAKGWKKRGWLDTAYPGAACQGAVLPTDWCGLGCTMWGRDVQELTNFSGYEGKGTQDLFLVWSKWYPAKKKIGCLVGAPASHVKRSADGLVIWEPMFVPDNEETAGHLRVNQRIFDGI